MPQLAQEMEGAMAALPEGRRCWMPRHIWEQLAGVVDPNTKPLAQIVSGEAFQEWRAVMFGFWNEYKQLGAPLPDLICGEQEKSPRWFAIPGASDPSERAAYMVANNAALPSDLRPIKSSVWSGIHGAQSLNWRYALRYSQFVNKHWAKWLHDAVINTYAEVFQVEPPRFVNFGDIAALRWNTVNQNGYGSGTVGASVDANISAPVFYFAKGSRFNALSFEERQWRNATISINFVRSIPGEIIHWIQLAGHREAEYQVDGITRRRGGWYGYQDYVNQLAAEGISEVFLFQGNYAPEAGEIDFTLQCLAEANPVATRPKRGRMAEDTTVWRTVVPGTGGGNPSVWITRFDSSRWAYETGKPAGA